MPVEQLTSPGTSGLAKDSNLVKFDQYIDAQIQSTRRMVKLVDLATALVTLSTGTLAYLLVLALVEHWLVPGGYSVAARFFLFTLLLSGAGYFSYRRLWPLCWRAINPVFAARTIEQSSPSLKNTLVNLLLFRQRRNEVSDSVYYTLEEQAARRLTRVPVDAAVDRGHLIRLGYVLIGVTAFAALYKVVSPKDPVVSAERVLLPWADIVPASRVKISAVEPGSVTIARGEFLNIAADVRGIGEDDPVVLRYTTADGQAVNKAVIMKLAGGGPRFECRLPAVDEAGGLLGIGQNLSYRIEAGDARTRTFDVRVVSAPAVMVERVEYDFPDYTGEPDRVVEGTGDVRAIEGTRVTVHARANGPIEEAYLDFDADGRRDTRLAHEATVGRASFVLALRDDRQTPRFSSYVVRFTNSEGRANQNPAKYSIEVIRDLDPEAALVAPREKTRDVRLDETVVIEVDARDPDFALAEVRLRGEALGRPNLDVPLSSQLHVGRFTGRYAFTPREHQLRAGDIVQYWVTAKDNRTPVANTGNSERQTFRIIAPNPDEAQRPERGAPGGQPQRQPNDGKQDGKQPTPPRGDGKNESKADQEGGDSHAQGGAEQPGGEGQRGNEGQPGQEGNLPGGEPGDGKSEPQRNMPGQDQGGGASSRQGQRGGEQNDPNAGAGGDADAGGDTPDGGADGGTRGRRSSGRGGDETKTNDRPLSSGGDHDSEAFNRIREHLKRSDQLPEDAQQNSNQEPRDEGDAAGDNQDSALNKPPRQDDGNRRSNPRESTADGTRGEGSSAERRGGAPQEGKREAATNDQSGKGDAAGENQRVRDEKSGTPTDGKREQSPVTDASGKNDGSPGRHVPDTAGNEGADLPDETKDSTANRQVNRDGANKTGQSEAANEGAGEADERGAGNDSATRGRDVPSAEKTGQPGSDSAGRGSTRRDGQGDRPGGERGDGKTGERGASSGDDSTSGAGQSADGKSGDRGSSARGGGERGENPGDGKRADSPAEQEGGADSADEKQGSPTPGERGEGRAPRGRGDGQSDEPNADDLQPGESKSKDSRAGGRGAPREGDNAADRRPDQAGAAAGDGGRFGTSDDAPAPGGGNVPDADATNLEYARRQTDLVLEKLSEQLNRKQVDENLLKNLGWTEEDLRRFVARWQERKEAARSATAAGEAARKELDDALKSLGLRPAPLRASQAPEDAMRDLRQGHRGAVPPEYRDRLREYNQGVSRSRQQGER